MKHTKTPWTFELLDMQGAGPYIHEDGGAIHFKGNPRNRKLNILLRHGVRCVNLHDDLVAACEAASEAVESGGDSNDPSWGWFLPADVLAKLRAVLAKEEGKT